MRYKALANASNLTIKFYLKVALYAKSNLSLYAYSNAFFTNVEDYKSTSSYFFKFASSTICYKSKGYYKCIKHINIYYYYIKDAIKNSKIKLTHILTAEIAVNSLTKPLNKTKHAT
ncbi:hypothetical protein HBH69_193290 [Parastagonospora nodorum]|nr:hypothetical protein HBI95_180040 [Parastagonospora nodorum]KAH5143520.1 hypothetical protein HBH69_193290 [Parastagonospora nodorum]